MTAGPRVGEGAYTVRAISRAAQVLELIQHSGVPLALNQVVKLSDLSKPTVFRMLRNLEDAGLVERVAGTDAYRLGLRCVALGQAYLEQADYRREALPILESLRDRCSETVHLAVLDTELRVVYVEKLEGTHAIGIMMSRVGRSAPSYCTGLGKALLSAVEDDPAARLAERGELVRKTDSTICDPQQLRRELAAIRERGFALDMEEHEPGVRCVAATVRDASGAVVAAISVAGPAQRMPRMLLTGELAEATVTAARDISRRLGATDLRARG